MLPAKTEGKNAQAHGTSEALVLCVVYVCVSARAHARVLVQSIVKCFHNQGVCEHVFPQAELPPCSIMVSGPWPGVCPHKKLPFRNAFRELSVSLRHSILSLTHSGEERAKTTSDLDMTCSFCPSCIVSYTRAWAHSDTKQQQ